jgi:hypothetical protein
MLAIPMLLTAPIVALLLPASGAFGPIAPGLGLGLVVVSMFLFGLANGPLDVALFTIRQRRTDPSWMGRAFAVSMAFNFIGYPFGALIAGALATDSLPATLVLSVVSCLVAGVLAFRLIPMSVPPPAWADASPAPVPEL